MENPYQSPQEAVGSTLSQRQSGLVRHVRVASILMAVHGGLVLLMGGLYCLMGVLFANAASNVPAGAPPQSAVMMATFAVMGLPAMMGGILQIVAGVRGYQFRSRTLGVLALSANLLSCLTVYCVPSAIGVTVYGLIVFLNPRVAQAFTMRDQGYTSEQILAHFFY